MCSVLEVSENGYFNWRTRGISRRKHDDRTVAKRIEDAFEEHKGRYGSTRIHAELKDQGYHCGRKRIVRIMREKQMSASRRRRSAKKTDSDLAFPLAPNLLKRDFAADAPNTKWMTDMTFIPTGEGWLSLAGVIDGYSHKVIGWAMGKEHDTALVKQALEMALAQRQPEAGLVHHSDRGSEYASKSYQEMLQQRGIVISWKRRHSSLGYLSPVEYEKRRKEMKHMVS